MSGPVTTADAAPDPGRSSPDPAAMELLSSRVTTVGTMPVQRALPQRGRRTVGAWCFFDHAGPVQGGDGAGGIGPHPHVGLQTVTWVWEGELRHLDSLGNEQPIRPGQLNLMTAGRGIVHAEEETGSGPVHLAQLWIAQPSSTRDGESGFEHHAELPRAEFGEGTATVLVGALGPARSPARRDTDHVGADLIVRSEMLVPTEPSYEYAVVPIDQPVEAGGLTIQVGGLLYLGPGRDELRIRVARPGRVVLLGGVPFPEQILMWWNYVARTRDEITAAHEDWTARHERFPVPDSRLTAVDVGPPPWRPGG